MERSKLGCRGWYHEYCGADTHEFFASHSMLLIGLLPKENVVELNDPELGAHGSAVKVSERDLLPEASETIRCFLLIAEVSERASLFMP